MDDGSYWMKKDVSFLDMGPNFVVSGGAVMFY